VKATRPTQQRSARVGWPQCGLQGFAPIATHDVLGMAVGGSNAVFSQSLFGYHAALGLDTVATAYTVVMCIVNYKVTLGFVKDLGENLVYLFTSRHAARWLEVSHG